jgi:peptidoglycan/xylan/chitin deacetylase (PgdA/CDA1 family)
VTFIKKNKIKTALLFGLIVLIPISFNCSDVVNDYSTVPRAGFCLTFDDDYIEDWYSISNLFLTNNVTATFFISDLDSLSQYEIHLLKELKAFGHEIGSHGMHHTNAVEYLKNHSLSEYYKYEIQPAINFMDIIGMRPTSFAYPFGRSNDSLDLFLLNYFYILRHVTIEQLQPSEKEIDQIDEIYYRFNGERYVAGLGIDVNYNISLEELKKVLIRAKSEESVVILFSHRPVDSSPRPYETEKSYLDSLFIIGNELGLKSYKFSDLIY